LDGLKPVVEAGPDTDINKMGSLILKNIGADITMKLVKWMYKNSGFIFQVKFKSCSSRYTDSTLWFYDIIL
jgi:hypothetical protein